MFPYSARTNALMQVKHNMVEVIRRDSFVTAECRLLKPEALFSGTQEKEAEKVIADFIFVLGRWMF